MFKFQSRASAPIIYFDADAKRLLAIIGKEASKQGIITAEQLPAAIAALETAIHAEQQHAPEASIDPAHSFQDHPPTQNEDEDAPAAKAVSLRQRAQPLLALLTESLSAGEGVVWGV